MSSSLRDIPGANRGSRRSRREPLGPRRRDGGVLRPGQPAALMGSRRKRRAFGPRVDRDPVNLLLGLCFVVLGVVGAVWLWQTNQVSVEATGITDGVVLSPQEAVGLEFTVAVDPTSRLDASTITFDGEEEPDTAILDTTDEGFVVKAPDGAGFPVGEHTVEVRVPRAVAGTETWELTFEVRTD